MARTKPHFHCPGCGESVPKSCGIKVYGYIGSLRQIGKPTRWHEDCYRDYMRARGGYIHPRDLKPGPVLSVAETACRAETMLGLLDFLKILNEISRTENSSSLGGPCYRRKDGTHSGDTRKGQRRQKEADTFTNDSVVYFDTGQINLRGQTIIRKDRRILLLERRRL